MADINATIKDLKKSEVVKDSLSYLHLIHQSGSLRNRTAPEE